MFSVRPSKQSLLRFLHIEKTAGSSLGHAFRRYFGPRYVRDYPNEGSRMLLPFLRLRPDGTRGPGYTPIIDPDGMRAALEERGAAVIAGHGPFERLSWLVPAERTIVFLRDPVERVASQYFHNDRVRRAAGMPPIQLPLIEWAADDRWRNVQARNTEGLDLDAAFVGFTERYAESIERLNRRFGLRLLAQHGNVNPKKRVGEMYDLDRDTRAELVRLNERDVELYDRLAKAVWTMP